MFPIYADTCVYVYTLVIYKIIQQLQVIDLIIRFC